MGWILFLVGVLGWHIGMYGMFKKAGIAPWKALIPFYNTWCIVEICKLKKWWFWIQLIPIAGQFITIWITIIFVMHFGRFNVFHHAATIFVPFIYFPWLGFSKDERFAGDLVFKNYKKPASREWVDAAIFAVVAATIIRTFIFEAYTIPTPSMEKTLLVNDFLFVNKVAYGPRIPQTPLSFPFVHNLLPRSQAPSYLKWIQLDYARVPGYRKVQRNDVVVFNFPLGDTIINLPDYGSARPPYQVLRDEMGGDKQRFEAKYGSDIIVHPMDKADNYIKRCVAVPNDVLQVKQGVLFINGTKGVLPEGSQSLYQITTNGTAIDFEAIEENYDIDIRWEDKDLQLPYLRQFYQKYGYYEINLSEESVEKISKLPMVTSIKIYDEFPKSGLFPFTRDNTWSVNDYGPLKVPAKGATVPLNASNIETYRRIISNYEGHTLEEKDGKFIIDGKETNEYTFKYNYYWMMGDNRHNSQDSRYWGFVPETHIVGRASLIWFSWENGPRWNRLFKSIK